MKTRDHGCYEWFDSPYAEGFECAFCKEFLKQDFLNSFLGVESEFRRVPAKFNSKAIIINNVDV